MLWSCHGVEMTNTLFVRFGEVHDGWLYVDLHVGHQHLQFPASYIYASLSQLATALVNLLWTEGEAQVTWTTEPVEFDFRFVANGEIIQFEVIRFDDARRVQHTGKVEIQASVSRLILLRTFWRGLRELETRIPTDEYWGRQFPVSDLTTLTRYLKQYPSQRDKEIVQRSLGLHKVLQRRL